MGTYEIDNMKIEVTDQILSRSELIDIIALDSLVYPEIYQSSFEQVLNRFMKFKECFITARFEQKIIGYICFFPITKLLYTDIIEGNLSTDIDIEADNVLTLCKNEGFLYIISIVVHPKFQHTHVIKWIMSEFDVKLVNFCSNYGVKQTLATVISESGFNVLHKSSFSIVYFDQVKKIKIMQRHLVEESWAI
jgi:hypothetical protein